MSVLVQHANTPAILIEHADIVVREAREMAEILREMVSLLQQLSK